MGFLTLPFLVGLLAAGLRLAAPILLAATGEVLVERSGILNLGVEASMLAGGFVGFAVSFYSGSTMLGVLSGMLAGLVMGAVMAFFSVTLAVDQIVAGSVLTIFALGATSFGYDLMTGVEMLAPHVSVLPVVPIPLLADLPFLGPVFFRQNALVYVSVVLALLAQLLLYRTRWGLKLRACGEDQRAAAATGVDVRLTRFNTLVLAGALAGLGGVSLTLGQLGLFAENITAGRGFMAIAAVVFGRWKPINTLLACVFFGVADALQLRLQVQGIGLPHQVLLMMPYILTLLALVMSVGRRTDVGTPAGPRELGVPYQPESL